MPESQSKRNLVHLSKLLSYVLRHGAPNLNLPMEASGYVSMQQLLQLPQFRKFTESQVEEVVATNDKKRFSITVDAHGAKLIRANQGHSIDFVREEQLLIPIEDPSTVAFCIHGTYLQHWERIRQMGISRMSRNHIHFAADEIGSNNVISGMRRDVELKIYVDHEQAINDGIRFFRSSNNVILSPGQGDTGVIPPEYFVRVVRCADGAVLFENGSCGT